MAPWLIAFTAAIYLWTAVELAWNGKVGGAVMFAGYVIGNIGIIMMVKE